MNAQSSDSLENFFRDRAENYNIEFREADWEKLEAVLDREMPVSFTLLSFIRRFLAIPLILIIGALSWFTYDRFQSQQIVENPPIEMKIQDEGVVAPTTQPEQNAIAESDSQPTNLSQLKNDQPSQIQNQLIAIDETSDIESDVVNKKNTETTDSKSIFAKKQEERIGYAVSEDGAYFAGDPAISELHFLFSIPPASVITTQTPTISSADVNELHPPSRSSKITYAIGAGYGPDFSTVGLGNFVAPGSRWAAIFEIGFSSKFLMNTGVIWVHNMYKAVEEYGSSGGYGPGIVSSDETFGECTMIDIPLNIRYNLLVQGRHQMFVSGGASTYLVLSQDYQFEYAQSKPNQPDSWSTDEMAAYPFGIINLSIGYQYALGRKGALQVEPFFKIPTTGIGFLEADLHTIGAYFIYKYRLGK